MKIASKFGLIIVVLALVACGDKAKQAINQLAAMKIAFNEESFIEQIEKGNVDAVNLFYIAGVPSTAKNKAGTPVLVAALNSNNEQILSLVMNNLPAASGEGAPVNLQDEKGNSPISIAAQRADTALISQLAQKGATAFIYDKEQYTPLHRAVEKNSLPTTQLLIDLDKKSNQENAARAVNFSNNSSETPLLIAARNKNVEIVKLLLQNGATVDTADLRGTTPLMAAVETENAALSSLLIEAKASINLYDANGATPLKLAIAKNNEDLIKLLIDKGADPDFVRQGDMLPIELVLTAKPFNLKLFNYFNGISKKSVGVSSNLLLKAIENNQLDVVSILLERGADANSKDENGKTILYLALEKGYGDLADTLIQKGADPNKATGTIPPLELAVRGNMIAVVKKLLELGANPNIRTNEGYTLAEVCVYKGYPEVLDMLMAKKAGVKLDYAVLWSIIDGKGKVIPVLLKYGANPNVLSQQGDPALYLAVSASQETAVDALLKYKAFPNIISEKLGTTALGIAAHIGNLNIIKLLVDAGAEIDMEDKFGATPLAYAAFQARAAVVEYLLSKGANPKHSDKQGRTIQDMVNASQGSSDVKEIIIEMLLK